MRLEQDKIGSVELLDHCLYGIQTQRSLQNFTVSDRTVNLTLIYAIVKVKKAAAIAHRELNAIEAGKADAIIKACDQVLGGQADNAFVTNALQGGAGTSTNMNVNEVIANMALISMGKKCGDYTAVHPLDDVNKGQSTNDVYPTALRIAAIELIRELSDECARLQEALQQKETEFSDVFKLGRTELMDAMPITLGQEFGAYAQAIARDRWRIYKVEERLRQVNLGGTAVGTGSNINRKYTYKVIEILRDLTGMGIARAEFPIDITQNNDVFVEVSGLVKALAVNLMKISTDLRLMNSGPLGGLGEITLPALQIGSTIMPGKVNPVIPEMVTQAAIKVIANDTAISITAAQGNFELNAFLPLIADCLLESLALMTRAVNLFRILCIDKITANRERCLQHLENSLVMVTALTPYIGYDQAAAIMDQCRGDPGRIRAVVLEKELIDESVLGKLLDYKKAATYNG